jgi:ElaB/YqjD/DUF883 family membrane-anchored ribosome-binding protein
MTYERSSLDAPPSASADEATTSDTADRVKQVAARTADRAGDVAGEAGAQAKVVVRDAKEQARQLLDQGRHHLDEEARARSQQAAGGLRTIADQLGALSDGAGDRAGALGDYARQGRQQLSQLADRLDEGPAAVLDDIRRFARRQPVVFLAAAGALGFVAGRLIRGARDAARPDTTDGTLPAPSAGDRTGGPRVPSALGSGSASSVQRDVPPITTAAAVPTADLTP